MDWKSIRKTISDRIGDRTERFKFRERSYRPFRVRSLGVGCQSVRFAPTGPTAHCSCGQHTGEISPLSVEAGRNAVAGLQSVVFAQAQRAADKLAD